jgi:hypothetical protein
MRPDENAAEAKKKATKAFYPELLDEDGFVPLHPRQKAETAVPKRRRIEEEVEEKRGRTESWHTFKTP